MNVVTIPKRLPARGELVLVSRAEYEALRAQAEGREFTPTKADLRALAHARKNFNAGKVIPWEDVKRDLESRRRPRRS